MATEDQEQMNFATTTKGQHGSIILNQQMCQKNYLKLSTVITL